MLDVNEMRNPIIAAYGLPNVDGEYTFYYDETNNVRKLHLTPDGMNIRSPECFVLGGVLHLGGPKPIDLAPLKGALRLQPNAGEIKLKHIASGGFLDLLRSARLGAFLEWLTAERLLIHYQVTDLLYWSIVDIIDSILTEIGAPQLMAVHPMLKDSLYSVLREDIDGTAELLARYDYPNVGRDRRAAFIAELLELVEQREHMLEHFSYYMLKGLLEMARGLDSLPYLEDEKPNVLIDGFGGFFANRLCLFKNGHHILDDEKQIEAYLESLCFADGGEPLRHYRFANSKTEPGVQISDAAAGLLGKLFTYLNRTSMEVLELDTAVMSDIQLRNLSLLANLLDRSTDECPGFAQYIISMEDRQRAAFLLEHIGLAN
jgi:hypothetical protein